MMSALGDAAAFLAQQWPCFPCGADKRPVTEHGFKDASRDPDLVRVMFDRPGAHMIGVPTGEVSDLVAIDLDVKNGAAGLEWLAANAHRLPRTRQHGTRSGGRHLLFRYPPGRSIRNSASKIAPGVDVRGSGGYVIVPPSDGYTIADDAMPAPMPGWLVELLDPPQAARPAPQPYAGPAITGDGTPYGLRALTLECEAIRNAAEGMKHHTLNKAAYSIGGLVTAGAIAESLARAELAAALAAIRDRCADWHHAEKTLRTAFEQGKGKPRTIAEAPPAPPPREYFGIGRQRHDPATGEIPPDDDASGGAAPVIFPATPFHPADLVGLRPREWVYGHFLIARFLSVMGAPGGTGKTAYGIGVALSVALGKPLLGETVHMSGPAWIYNLEDPRDELLRRVYAACLAHDIPPADLAGRLYLDSGRDRPLVVAERTATGAIVAMPVVEPLIAELRARGVRLLNVDPFVKSHRLEENRNEQVDFAATLWNRVADAAGCAILLTHHFRKGAIGGEADAFRGASALIDASRAAVSLSPMSEKEAERCGIEMDLRRFYVRADNAKLNLAPPPKDAVWLNLQSVELPNGDRVQAVKRWEPPSPWAGIPRALIIEVLHVIAKGRDNGDLWSPRREAKDGWAGKAIAENTSLNETQAGDLLRDWERGGMLKVEEFTNAKREKRKGYRVNDAEFSKLKLEWEGSDE
jgi:hypothetical protein